MGNALALKIHHIGDTNLLKTILFSDNQPIVPYIHYITKINNYYPENIRKNLVINQFTIFDILTRKEYVIRIERVESTLFFDRLSFTLDTVPIIQNFLLVTKVFNGSLAELKALKPHINILLGLENEYFTKFEDVEKAIKNKQNKFIFYDFLNEKIDLLDFNTERYGDYLGFECELRRIEEMGSIIKSVKKDNTLTNSRYSEIKNDGINQGTLLSKKIESESNMDNHSEQNYLNTFTTTLSESKMKLQEDKSELTIENNKNKFQIYTEINEEICDKTEPLINKRTQFAIQNENLKPSYNNLSISLKNDKIVNKDPYELEDLNDNKILHEGSNLLLKNETILEPTVFKEKSFSNSLNNNALTPRNEIIDSKYPKLQDEIIYKEINLSKKIESELPDTKFSSTSKNIENEISISNGNNNFNYQNECKNNNEISNYVNENCNSSTYLNTTKNRIKNKYNKKLLIYEKVDSNYNFLKISVGTCSQKIILIKGFKLWENELKANPSISILESNTIYIN
jgi:hypothetical protein